VTTAELAIVVTGAVGLGTPALSARFEAIREGRRAIRERVSKDLDELRSVLDELTAVMFEHTTALVAVERWMQRSTFGDTPSKPAPELRPSRKTLYTLNARLWIRLGRDDPLVRSLGSYLELVDRAVAEIEALWPKNEPFDYSDAQLDQRAGTYWAAYEAFVDAAQAAAGSAR
jgi:hypothetical protein